MISVWFTFKDILNTFRWISVRILHDGRICLIAYYADFHIVYLTVLSVLLAENYYTVGLKKGANLYLSVTLSEINRF